MYNHARTLLLNLATGFPGDLAEEPIPEDYRPKTLPHALQQVRRVLFGANPDRPMLNYRTRQLMAVLHATEYCQYVLDLDPRITYDFQDTIPCEVFDPRVTAFRTVSPLHVIGRPAVPDQRGQLQYRFRVRPISIEVLEVQALTLPPMQLFYDLEINSQLSPEYLLPGTGYRFRVTTDDPGASWEVDVLLRPRRALKDLAYEASRLGEPTLLELFSDWTREPWKTFYSLWTDHPELPYRMSGLLLALIYRTEALGRT